MFTKFLLVILAMFTHPTSLQDALNVLATAPAQPEPASVATVTAPPVKKAVAIKKVAVKKPAAKKPTVKKAVAKKQPAAPLAPASPTPAQPLQVANNTTTASATALSAKDIMGRVQRFYKDAKHLTAKFEQRYVNTTVGKTTRHQGRMWIQKPGKMRWEYHMKKRGKAKVRKSMVSDGSTLWVVEHDLKQVTKKNIKSEVHPVAISFLFGKGDLSREFKGHLASKRKFAKGKDFELVLEPHKPTAQYRRLILVVDATNFRVKQSIVTEPSGRRNHFFFYEPNTKTPVKASYFVVNPKALRGYNLVDADKEFKRKPKK